MLTSANESVACEHAALVDALWSAQELTVVLSNMPQGYMDRLQVLFQQKPRRRLPRPGQPRKFLGGPRRAAGRVRLAAYKPLTSAPCMRGPFLARSSCAGVRWPRVEPRTCIQLLRTGGLTRRPTPRMHARRYDNAGQYWVVKNSCEWRRVRAADAAPVSGALGRGGS